RRRSRTAWCVCSPTTRSRPTCARGGWSAARRSRGQRPRALRSMPTARDGAPVKVSLIATVKDGAEHLEEFLGSLRAQSRAPDEVVIVDGGSTDGTVDQLRRADGIVVIEELRANIARGRNVAIA